MELELELKHLACYLPYGLNLVVGSMDDYSRFGSEEMVSLGGLTELSTDIDCRDYKDVKPILRPLSDLNKSKQFIHDLRSEENNAMLLWGVEVRDESFISYYNDELKFSVLEYLYKNHFDVFELIPKGLAIDMNTL